MPVLRIFGGVEIAISRLGRFEQAGVLLDQVRFLLPQAFDVDHGFSSGKTAVRGQRSATPQTKTCLWGHRQAINDRRLSALGPRLRPDVERVKRRRPQ
jgi:hypothetical protein